MSQDVAIASMRLAVRGLFQAPASADAWVRLVLGAIERELDAALPADLPWIVIPKLELDLEVVAGDARLAPQAIARAIAGAIKSAARQYPADAGRSELRAPSAVSLVRLAEQVRKRNVSSDAGDPMVGGTIGTFEGDRALRRVDDVHAIARERYPIEALGRMGRSGRWRELWAADMFTVRALLARVLEQLRGAASVCEPSDRAMIAYRFERAADRALMALRGAGYRPESGARGLDPRLRLLLAMAEIGRVSPELILASGRTASALVTLLEQAEHGASLGTSDGEGDWPGARLGMERHASTELARGIEGASRPVENANNTYELAALEHPEPVMTSVDAHSESSPRIGAADDVDAFTHATRIAGLAFFVRPLLDLGMAQALAAIHPEPTLAIFDVMRRIAASMLGGEPEDDYAIALLAGLLDVPPPEDVALDAQSWPAPACAAFAFAAGADMRPAALRSPDRDAACEAWAQACIDDVCMRFCGVAPSVNVPRDVLGLTGQLVAYEDALEVHLPFTPEYEALLLAGLLVDTPYVPWLDHRTLRFVFRSTEHGGTS